MPSSVECGADDGLRELFPVTVDGIRPVSMFAHYVGDDRDTIREDSRAATSSASLPNGDVRSSLS